MKRSQLIQNALKFLETEYGFKFSLINDRGTRYVYSNKYGRFEYYEWQQFDESEFRVYFNNEFQTVNMFFENPEELGYFRENNKGFRRLFKDSRSEYWSIIEKTLRKHICENDSLFGVKIT